MSHNRRHRHRPQPGMLMLALLALCALLGGGTAAQAHVHPLHAVARDGSDRSTTLSTPDEDCALCDARAAFEPLVPGNAPAAARPVSTAAAGPIARAVADPLLAPRGHGWRSRAPPLASPI